MDDKWAERLSTFDIKKNLTGFDCVRLANQLFLCAPDRVVESGPCGLTARDIHPFMADASLKAEKNVAGGLTRLTWTTTVRFVRYLMGGDLAISVDKKGAAEERAAWHNGGSRERGSGGCDRG